MSTDTGALADAIRQFEESLPGWWWSVCHCQLSRDASCGPDFRVLGTNHPHVTAFDEGIHDDNPGTLADALLCVMHEALKQISELPT